MTPKIVNLTNGRTAAQAGYCVELDGERLAIRGLVVDGSAAAAARHCVEQGGDAEDAVRRMLEIGGMVLQHGANSTLVEAVITEIRREGVTEASLREMAERVASKGLRYEEQVQPVLERAAAANGDIVEATGASVGIDGRCKKGDFVISLNPESIGGRDRRVVVEAKDQPAQRLGGKDGALTYLMQAMENRDAAAGVLVCASDVPALAGQRLRVYPANRIFVRYDKTDPDPLALEVACQLARGLAARTLGDEDAGMSPRLLAEKVERLREVIEAASEIRGGFLEARRGINRVDTAYQTMRSEALAVVYELEDRLAR